MAPPAAVQRQPAGGANKCWRIGHINGHHHHRDGQSGPVHTRQTGLQVCTHYQGVKTQTGYNTLFGVMEKLILEHIFIFACVDYHLNYKLSHNRKWKNEIYWAKLKFFILLPLPRKYFFADICYFLKMI